jgi:hypothetical protein
MIYGPETVGLQVGEVIAVADVESDTVEAEVLEVFVEAAKICIRWDKVLHSA